MRVVEARRFGGPEVLVAGEGPDPIAGPGQVVVDVAVADVLFVETQIRRGLHGEYFTVHPPYVPGAGVAGVVAAVGLGVDPGWAGRRVAGHPATGGYAERALVAVEALIPVPDGLGLPEAAALLHDGPTALALTDAARIRAGDRVLVVAAAGGLGLLLVQLARAAVAQVVGAARGGRKLDLVRALGATAVVDYSEPDWARRARTALGAGPSVVFDGAGGRIGRAAFEITARDGWFSAHGAPSGGFTVIDPGEATARAVTVRGIHDVRLPAAEVTRLAGRAMAEAAAGRIRPIIGQTFPLERSADAHAAIEARHTLWKTLLLV